MEIISLSLGIICFIQFIIIVDLKSKINEFKSKRVYKRELRRLVSKVLQDLDKELGV